MPVTLPWNGILGSGMLEPFLREPTCWYENLLTNISNGSFVLVSITTLATRIFYFIIAWFLGSRVPRTLNYDTTDTFYTIIAHIVAVFLNKLWPTACRKWLHWLHDACCKASTELPSQFFGQDHPGFRFDSDMGVFFTTRRVLNPRIGTIFILNGTRYSRQRLAMTC